MICSQKRSIIFACCCSGLYRAALPVLYAGRCRLPVGELDAITKPSQDVILSFDRPGRIAELPVKEGDSRSPRANSSPVRKTPKRKPPSVSPRSPRTTTPPSRPSKRCLTRKRKDLDNPQDQRMPSSHYELDQATSSKYESKKPKSSSNKFQQKQNASTKYEQAKAAFEKTRLLSPIDGIVQETMIKVGESCRRPEHEGSS